MPESGDTSRVRPLLVGNDFLPDVGGIQQYVAALAERLPDVAVLAGAHPGGSQAGAAGRAGRAGRDSGDRGDDAALGYPVVRGHRRFLWPTPTTRRLLRDTVARHRADCVVFTAPFPLPPLGSSLGVPWAVVCHGAELVWPASVPGVAAAYRSWLCGAACLFTVSRYTAGHLRRLVGGDGPPIRLARPGVDPEAYRPAEPTAAAAVRADLGVGEAPLVVSVGRLVPRKGTDRLIRALPAVRRAVPGTRLVVVGDGRWRAHLERLADRVSPGAVVFAGRLPAPRVPALYAAADVAAMPVRRRWGGLEQEGFGMVFVEAQASGVPVVAGRSGGAPETVRDAETGLVVDGDEPAEIAAALVRLLADAALRRRFAARGREHVLERFTWDRTVTRFSADLAALAAGRPLERDA